MMATPTSDNEFAAFQKRWLTRRDELHRLRALVSGADFCDAFLNELDVVLRNAGDQLLSLQQAAFESGYSADHLGRLVRHGRFPNKIGFGHTTPLMDEAVAALAQAWRTQQVIGDAQVFPSPTDASQPCSRHLVRDWWERLATRASIPSGQQFGWHALRRKFASDLKAALLRDLAHLGGWKSAQTILACYMAPDEATQRAALAQRKSLCASGLA
jgi:integrase